MEDKLPKLYLEVTRSNPLLPLPHTDYGSSIFGRTNQASSTPSVPITKTDENVKDEQFYMEFCALKNDIDSIRQRTETILSLKAKAIQVTLPQEQEEISRQLIQVITTAGKDIPRIKEILDKQKELIEDYKQKNEYSAETKMRENIHSILTFKFRQSLQSYQVAQTEYRNKVKQKMARQIHLAVPQATDEEVIEMVNADISPESLLKMKFPKDVLHENTSNAFANLEQKYDDIRLLEKNVVEMHQMFVDISSLIGAQSDLLNQIEFSVNSAKDYAQKAQVELAAVRASQRKAKRRTMCISVTIGVVAVVILLGVFIGLQR